MKPTVLSFAVIFILVFLLLSYLNSWEWTGFPTIDYPIEPNHEIKPYKTLWDWLQLLIIPIALFIGGYILNKSMKDREIKAAEDRAKVDRKLAEKQRELDREITKIQNEERALSQYFDRMSDLLLNFRLRGAKEDSILHDIARTRTLTILRRLNGERKGIVIKFLYEANLINYKKEIDPVINLENADLREMTCEDDEFIFLNLEGANLVRAKLKNTDIYDSNLKKVSMLV